MQCAHQPSLKETHFQQHFIRVASTGCNTIDCRFLIFVFSQLIIFLFNFLQFFWLIYIVWSWIELILKENFNFWLFLILCQAKQNQWSKVKKLMSDNCESSQYFSLYPTNLNAWFWTTLRAVSTALWVPVMVFWAQNTGHESHNSY